MTLYSPLRLPFTPGGVQDLARVTSCYATRPNLLLCRLSRGNLPLQLPAGHPPPPSAQFLSPSDAPACVRLALQDAGTYDRTTKSGGATGAAILK